MDASTFFIVLIYLSISNSLPYKTISKYFLFRETMVLNGFLCSEQETKFFLEETILKRGMIASGFENLELEDFKKLFKYNHFRTGFFYDFRCEHPKNIFSQMSRDLLLNSTNIILIYGDEETFKYVEYSKIAFDSDVAVVLNDGIYDVYKVGGLSSLEVEKIGFWNESYEKMEKRRPRHNLGGYGIKGSMAVVNLEMNETNQEERLLDYNFQPERDVLSRFGYVLHKHLGHLFNFKNEYIITDTWGYYNETIDGWEPFSVFGLLKDGHVDFGISVSRLAPPRMNVATFLPPVSKFRSAFVFKHPSTFADYRAFAKPFSIGSWFGVFAFIFSSGIALFLIRHYDFKDEPINEKSISSSLVIVVGTVCQQGAIASLRLPNRILFIFLEIGSLLIYSYYGASVLSFLLMPSPRTINTIDKLINSPLLMYAENQPYQLNHFTANVSRDATKAYERRLKGPTREQDKFIGLASGVKRMRKGGFAFYAQDTNVYNEIERTFSSSEKCSLAEIEMIVMWISTSVRKKSTYKELMYKGMIALRERGVLNREDLKWHARWPTCIGQEESDSVKLEATFVAFFIYLFGLLISFLFFAFEILKSKYKQFDSMI